MKSRLTTPQRHAACLIGANLATTKCIFGIPTDGALGTGSCKASLGPLDVSRYRLAVYQIKYMTKKDYKKQILISQFGNNRQITRCISHRVSKGKYNLTTKARRKVLGRNKQLDEGVGSQTRKCHDPLNCVALIAFRKHDTWAQTWIGIFGVHLHNSRKSPAWLWPQA